MEITVVHGQLHKGSTYHVSEKIAEQLGEGSEVHEFFLPADGPSFCVGCYQCILKGENNCPHADKVQKIAEAMKNSEVIIFDTPTYCFDMSGQLKTLLDHLGYMWLSHRPGKEMFTKIGIAVSTTAGAGAKRVTKSIAKNMFWWGIPKVYKLPVAVSAMKWSDVSDKIKRDIDRKAASVVKEIKRSHGKAEPGIGTRFLFGLMRKMHAGNTWNPTDGNYWKNNGWTLDARPWRA